MRREVLPEILDQLPAQDERAQRSRRDLFFINRLMGNFRWLLAELIRLHSLGIRRVVELGAGDGNLCRAILAARSDFQVEAVDLQPLPSGLDAVKWHQGDVMEMDLRLDDAVVVSNLFLHHFSGEQLASMGQRLSSARVLLASEPERRQLHLWQGRLIHPLINEVTRHDMAVSVGAGFRDGELVKALGMGEEWAWRTQRSWLGAHRIVGERRE